MKKLTPVYILFVSLFVQAQEDVFTIKAQKIYTQGEELDISVQQRDLEDSLSTELSTELFSLGLQSYQAPQTTLRPRGLPAGSTKIIFDGMELSDPSSIADDFQLQVLHPQSLGKVQFFPGAHSSLYGSHSLSGVLNLAPLEKNRLSFQSGSGEYAYSNINLFKKDQYLLSLNLNHSNALSQVTGKGELETDPYSQLQGYLRINQDIGEQSKIIFKFLGINRKFDIDSDLLGDKVQDDTDTYYQNLFGFDFFTPYFSIHTFHNDIQRYLSTYKQYSKGRNTKFDLRKSFQTKKLQTLIGLEFRLFSMSLTAGSLETSTALTSEESYRVSPYIHSSLKIKDTLITPEARFIYDKNFKSALTYKTSLSHPLSSKIKLKSSFSRSFNAPTLFQLHSIYGNISLEPEKVNTYEIGLEVNNLRHQVTLNTYLTQYKEQISYNFTDQRYFNQTRSLYRGLEFSHLYKFSKKDMIKTNYSYTHARDENNNQLARIPYHQLSLLASMLFQKLTFSPQFQFKGARKEYEGTKLYYYLLTHTDFTYQLKPKLNLNFNIHNLFDKTYQEALNYQTRRRSFYAGFNYAF